MLVGANSLQVLTIKSLSTIMRVAAGSNATFLVAVPTLLQDTYYPQPPTTAMLPAALSAHYPLPTIPNCPSFTAHCPLPTAHTAYCLLPTLPAIPKAIKKNLQLAHLRFFKTKLFICATKQLFKIFNLKIFSFEYFCNQTKKFSFSLTG